MNEDPKAMLETADRYYFGRGVEKNLETALNWYIKAAKSEDHKISMKARTQAGLMYYNGIGTEVNYTEAAKWLNLSPLNFLRDAPAVYTLAEMYFYGRGVKQDYSRALSLYEFAAGSGNNVNAVFRIGEIYEYGYGLEIDNEYALKCYRKAANHGNVVAMCKLGLIYETGEIVEQDYVKAKDWYLRAAEQGNEFARAKIEELAEILS